MSTTPSGSFIVAGTLFLGVAFHYASALPAQVVESMEKEGGPVVHASRPAADGHPRLTWDSEKVLSVKGDWGTLFVSFPHWSRPADGEKRRNKLDAILAQRFSGQDLRDLAETCTSLPVVPKDWGLFDRALLQRMLDVFVTSGDRESLVTMLSRRFPPNNGSSNTETEVFLIRYGVRLGDPILILGEAYSKCQIPDVRTQIAAVVRHAFVGSGIQGADDRAFVANAMRWYQENKANLIFNVDYTSEWSGLRDYVKHPIFVSTGRFQGHHTKYR